LASDGKPFIAAFQSQCPHAYSWAFDDAQGLHFCRGADYEITFCGNAAAIQLSLTGKMP
jgi:hypothetical protein